MDLDGTSTVVTGAASGLGAATARHLARLGAAVVVADVQDEKGEELAEAIGGQYVHTDVTQTGQIVAAVDVGQSTVSAHLKVLAEVRFVLFEHRGAATYYRINDACVECFPTAADIVMGRPVPAQPGSSPAAQPEGARP